MQSASTVSKVCKLQCSSRVASPALTHAYVDLIEKDVVLAAEELRHAATALGKATGAIDTERILDVIFRDFCIGK